MTFKAEAHQPNAAAVPCANVHFGWNADVGRGKKGIMDNPSDSPASSAGWRARLRVQQVPYGHVKSEENTASIEVDGQTLVISGPNAEGPLNSQEVILNARGFQTEEEATNFGAMLRSALSVRSAVRRTGIDLGDDRAPSGLFRAAREALEKGVGAKIRDSVHGLDVFEDHDPTIFFGLNPGITVSMTPETFVPSVAGTVGWVNAVCEAAIEAAQLLNLADQGGPPIVRLSLSMAALERLAPPIAWSRAAATRLSECARAASDTNDLDQEERDRLAESIKGLRDFGASGGRRVRELLKRRGLDDLNKKHREAAGIRGKVLHGTPVPRAEVDQAVTAVRDIVAQILEGELRDCGVDPLLLKEAVA